MLETSAVSRYGKTGYILDNQILRTNRKVVYVDAPDPVVFEELSENTRIRTQGIMRLDTIATAFYGDPKLWWVIADFQPIPIMNPMFIRPGTELIIPSQSYVISNILKR